MTRRWLAGIGTVLAASIFSAAQARRANAKEVCHTSESLAALAQDMESREAALDRREASIAAKEADLRAVEERLQERMAQLKSIRAEIAAQLARIDEVEDDRRDDLVRMLQSMRPKQGAPILSQLEDELAVAVVDRMSPGKAGKLLAALPPGKAADLMQKLSQPIEVASP
jgi:flagellar motility protein MotE (MotC chaperone)